MSNTASDKGLESLARFILNNNLSAKDFIAKSIMSELTSS